MMVGGGGGRAHGPSQGPSTKLRIAIPMAHASRWVTTSLQDQPLVVGLHRLRKAAVSGTRFGPVEAVERTIEFVSVRVGPVWINIWGAFGSSSGHPTKFAYVERSGLREEMDESEVIEDDEVTNERGTSSGMTVSGEGPGMEQ